MAGLAFVVIVRYSPRQLCLHGVRWGSLEASRKLSLAQSFGFIDEDDELWQKRAAVHEEEVKAEMAVWERMKPCKTCNGSRWHAVHLHPSFTCSLERRTGSLGDGGKWVCNPDRIAELTSGGQPCLVYSVGSLGMFDFERAVNAALPQCEIHIFDKSPWEEYGKAPPSFVQYHVAEIGPNRSIPDLVKELGHVGRTIQLLKIDCEGCEKRTFRSWFREGVFIQQVLVEYHFGKGVTSQQLEFFQFFREHGFVMFHKEVNVLTPGCIEYGFLHLSPSFR